MEPKHNTGIWLSKKIQSVWKDLYVLPEVKE